MGTSFLEWDERTNYVLTELCLTILNLLVLTVIAFIVATVIITHLRYGKSFFTTVRPLLETIYSEYIGFVPSLQRRLGEDKVDVVFNGYQEKTFDILQFYKSGKDGRKFSVIRLWVRIYFIILAGVIVMWTLAIFSSSLFYEKDSSCSDVSRDDTDHTCFQLSHREDVPTQIQDIIDQYPGKIVPCEEVTNFISTNNITYDLEVICYHYHLDLVSALAISYGTMKSLSYAISLIITGILELTNKCCSRSKGKTGFSCCRKVSRNTLVGCQLLLILSSVVLVAVFATGMALLHNLPATQNTSFDYMRGDTFSSYVTVAVYVPLTLFYTIALFPWWAFKPLDDPLRWKTDGLSDEQISKRLNYMIHYVVLHERFSTDYIYEAENCIYIEDNNTITPGDNNNTKEHESGRNQEKNNDNEFIEHISASLRTSSNKQGDDGKVSDVEIELERVA